MKHRVIILSLIAIIASGFVSISAPRASEVTRRTLQIADIFKASPINPLHTTSTISANLLDLIYDPLIELTSDGNIESAIAKSWKVSPDGLQWTFYLHDNVRFHDDSPLTADDIKATYEAIRSSKSNFYALGFENIESLDVLSSHAIIIRLRRYDSFLPFFLRHVYIMPRELAENPSPDAPVIGTGAFRLKSFAPEHIELEANESYYRGRPFLDRVVVDIYTNRRKCLTKLIAGGADLVLLVDVVDYDIFKNVESVTLHTPVSTFYYWIAYNIENPVLRSKAMRVALNHAVDRERVGKANDGEPATFFAFERADARDSRAFGFDYAPARSIAMIEAEGWRLGRDNFFHDKNGNLLEVSMTLSEGDDISKRIAQYLQDDFQGIGISLKLEILNSFGDLVKKCFVKRQHITTLIPSNVRAGVPLQYLFLHSSQINGGLNFSGYHSIKVDKALDEIRYNQHPKMRSEAKKRLAKLLCDDPPGIPVLVRRVPALINKKFIGFSADTYNFFSSFRNVRIREDE